MKETKIVHPNEYSWTDENSDGEVFDHHRYSCPKCGEEFEDGSIETCPHCGVTFDWSWTDERIY